MYSENIEVKLQMMFHPPRLFFSIQSWHLLPSLAISTIGTELVSRSSFSPSTLSIFEVSSLHSRNYIASVTVSYLKVPDVDHEMFLSSYTDGSRLQKRDAQILLSYDGGIPWILISSSFADAQQEMC